MTTTIFKTGATRSQCSGFVRGRVSIATRDEAGRGEFALLSQHRRLLIWECRVFSKHPVFGRCRGAREASYGSTALGRLGWRLETMDGGGRRASFAVEAVRAFWTRGNKDSGTLDVMIVFGSESGTVIDGYAIRKRERRVSRGSLVVDDAAKGWR